MTATSPAARLARTRPPRRCRRLAVPLLAIALLALAPLALGKAGEPSAAWSEGPRDVAAWPQGGGFAVRSARDSGAGADEIAADYDAASARLGVRLQATAPQAADLGASLGLRAVTEFRDLDGDGRLGPSDQVVRRVAVPGTPAVGHVEPLPDGGWRAIAVHTLPPDGPLAAPMRVELSVEARATPLAGKDPTRLDVFVRVLDGWARNGTHIALETGLDSGQDPAAVSADAVRLGDGGLALTTAWQDGQGTVAQSSDRRAASFVRAQPADEDVVFPAAVSAAWRPAGDGPVAAGNIAIYLGAAFVAAAAVAVPAWKRLHG